jgi:intergrase/recombinase
MLLDLTNACFAADARQNVNPIRRILQAEYTERLINIVLNKNKQRKYDHLTVSAAFDNLNHINKYISKVHGVDKPTKAHRKYLAYRIHKTLYD